MDKEIKNKPIFVTGTARSGISIIGGILHLCGAWGGEFVAKDKHDSRGIFENAEIRESIVRPFLRGIKADPLGQLPLPDIAVCKELANKICNDWHRRVKGILRGQGYDGGLWFFANSLSCLIWPLWARAFPDAQWIIVRRKDEDIVQSCMKTGFMRAHKKEEDWQGWINVHKERLKEMIGAGLNVWQIWPQRVIQGKLGELHDMVDRLGLQWDKTQIADFIAPILWKKGVFEVSE